MQIDEITLARTVWFVNFSAINPMGLAFGPISKMLIDRYGFLTYPTAPTDFDFSKGIAYGNGQFQFEGNSLAVGLTIYSTGWMGDSLVSTDASDAFLKDLASWAISHFPIKDPVQLITRYVYDSQLYLTSDVNITAASEKLRTFTDLLKKARGSQTEEVWGLLFNPDGSTGYSFSFERKANTPYAEKKYFTKAAVSTERHIKLLDEFEKLF